MLEEGAASVARIEMREIRRQLNYGQRIDKSREFLSRMRAARSSQVGTDDHQLRLHGLHQSDGVWEVAGGEYGISVLAEHFAYVRLHINRADDTKDVGADVGPTVT